MGAMTKHTNRLLWLAMIVFWFFSLPVLAQDDWDEEGEIEDTEVVIEKDRKIVLPPANRGYEKVAPLPIESNDEAQQYQFNNVEFIPPDVEPKLRVLTIKDQELKKLYGNYLKVGAGNYASSLIEGYFNSKRSKDYSVGAYVKSLASARGPVDKKNSASSHLKTRLFGKYITEPVVFNGAIEYGIDRSHFYGYSPGLEVDKDTIEQNYQRFKFLAGAEDSNNNPNVDYVFQAYFGTTRDTYKAKENETGLTFDGSLKLNETLGVNWETQLFVGKRKDITELRRNYWRLRPTVSTEIDQFKVAFGVNMVYEDDTLKNNDRFHFVPVVTASYDLAPEISVYAGVQGDVIRNSLDKFAKENPFIGRQVTIANTVKRLELYGGIKGEVMDALNFETGLSLADYRNLHFYVNSATDSARFDIVYDTRKVPVIHWFGELGYGKSDDFLLSIRGDIYAYDTKQVDRAWHRPNFMLSIFSSYNFYDKIILTGSVNAMGGLEGLNLQSDTSKKLDGIFDINFKAEYLWSKRFSAFANFSNIGSKRYERYLNYPSRGLAILGGITYSF